MNRQSVLDDIKTHTQQAQTWLNEADTEWLLARDEWQAGNDHQCLYHLLGVTWRNVDALQEFMYPYSPYWYYGIFWYFLNYYTIESAPEYDLTWKAICEAWIKNDFEGRAPTIAIIDRMRQILWDEPFYIQWAARPETKEL